MHREPGGLARCPPRHSKSCRSAASAPRRDRRSIRPQPWLKATTSCFYAGFDLMDVRHVDLGARANRGCGILGNLAGFGKSLSGCQLNLQPLRKLVRVTPDVTHFLTRVTWNQLLLLTAAQKDRGNFLQAPSSMIPQLESGSLRGANGWIVRNWDWQWRNRATTHRDKEAGAR